MTTFPLQANREVLPRISWGFLAANAAVTLVVCLLVNLTPTRTTALLSLTGLILLTLWRLEFALASLVNGMAMVSHTWASIGLQGITLPLVTLILLLGYAVHSVRFGFRLRMGSIPYLVFGLGLLMIVGLTYTRAPGLGPVRLFEYMALNLMLFGVAILNHHARSLSRLLWGIVAFGLILAFFSYIDILMLSSAQTDRFTLGNINPIWYARGLGIVVVLLLALTSENRKPHVHAAKWLLIVALLYLIVAAASRGPLAATLATVCIYLYWIPGRRFKHGRAMPIALFLAFAILAFILLPRAEVTDRLTVLTESYKDISTIYRVRAFFTGIELFLEHPLIGVGTAGFSAFSFLKYPHNILVEVASEYGLVGLTLLGALATATIRQCRRLSRALVSSEEIGLFRGFVLITIYALLNAQVSGSITGNTWIWLGLGGIWALSTLVARRQVEQDTREDKGTA